MFILCENIYTVISNQECVLELCSSSSICCYYGPSVRPKMNIIRALDHHWLDCKCHSRLHYVLGRVWVVINNRFCVKHFANSMTCK